MKSEIIQIIPAPEALYAVYATDRGKRTSQVICLALMDDGKIRALDAFGDEIDFCDSEYTCFKGFVKYSKRCEYK